jgi:hypothetical protein
MQVTKSIDCWSILFDKVYYDLTDFVDKHGEGSEKSLPCVEAEMARLPTKKCAHDDSSSGW